jgi:hypothetical protein
MHKKLFYNFRWLVICDDEMSNFQTREQAKSYANWLNRHPSNSNIRVYGPYKNVKGVASVIDLDWDNAVKKFVYIDDNDAVV